MHIFSNGNPKATCNVLFNQIASDGATENVSAMKQLATLSAIDVFGKSLHVILPKDIKVAFDHPTYLHRRYSSEETCPTGSKNLLMRW